MDKTTAFEFDHLFGGRELFVERRAFRAWLSTASLKASALASAQAVDEAVATFAQRDVRPQIVGDVAVINVSGPIIYKGDWLSAFFGLVDIQELQQQFRMAMADGTVASVVFRINSPGGVIDMMPEFAAEIFESKGRGTKQVIAVADTLVASCAYWLASQADAIYASPSSQLGAIGVFCEHTEVSGMLAKAGVKITLIAHGDHKVDGNPYEPLSDAARADIQASVDEVGDWFDSAVARGRKVSKATVLDKFGQGKLFRGPQAIKLGLADKAGTFDQIIAGLATASRKTSGVRASRSAPAAEALPRIDAAVAQAATPATSTRAAADTSCDVCAPDCPCDLDECAPDCPTCVPECACRATVTAPDDADQATADAAAIAIVLSERS